MLEKCKFIIEGSFIYLRNKAKLKLNAFFIKLIY